MKPIKLKIKGVNSFIEEQEVDFETLTQDGLFGIFGPTGSGKSTILDGITLALYGEVARESKQFINTNCDRCQVSFEFQISNATVKRYLVQREFRFHVGKNTTSSGKCKLVDITDGQELVLADTVTRVKEECKSIIGLSLEDFTRTVVLPQGKFSEFLKLEGNQRGTMLERLFNLEQYGDTLKGKLAHARGIQEDCDNTLQGELNAYEGINEDVCTECKGKLNQVQINLTQSEQEQKEISIKFDREKELWGYQQELNRLLKEMQEVSSNQQNINALEEKLRKAERAKTVIPYVTAFEMSQKNKLEMKSKYDGLKKDLDQAQMEKNEIEINWKQIQGNMKDDLPKLKAKKDDLEQVVEKTKEMEHLDGEKRSLEKQYQEKGADVQTISRQIKTQQELIESEEDTRKSIALDVNFKERIQQGVTLSLKYSTGYQALEDINLEIKKLNQEVANQENKKTELSLVVTEKKAMLEFVTKEREVLEKNKPITQEEFGKLQEFKNTIISKWNNYHKYLENVQEIETKIINEKEILASATGKIPMVKDELEDLKIQFRTLEIEGLAYQLRKDLKKGEVCPVCGSIHHELENLETMESLDTSKLEKEIKQKEKSLKETEKSVIEMTTRLKQFLKEKQTNLDQIAELGEAFQATTIETITNQVHHASAEIERYHSAKVSNDEAIRQAEQAHMRASGEVIAITGMLEQNKERLSDRMKKYELYLVEFEPIKAALETLKSELDIQDFSAKEKEMKRIEKQIETLSKNIEMNRNTLKNLSVMLERSKEEQGQIQVKLASSMAILEEKKRVIEDIQTKVLSKQEPLVYIEQLLERTRKEIHQIMECYDKTEVRFKEITLKYDILKADYSTTAGKLENACENHQKNEHSLQEKLQVNHYDDVDDVKKDRIDGEEIARISKEIADHIQRLSKLQGAIETYQASMKGCEVTKEAWEKTQERKQDIDMKVESLKKDKIQLETQVKQLVAQLEKMKELLARKKESERKLALWRALERLLRGKAFVEFVASTRLRYVAVEASRQLKEITNGNYGLEIDETNNARFIIRDYKNGGVARDTSTLSGGETFLASLALALALSAEIQLKGTAPLELFFLDEGFGTLDDNLLEVVMDSLEKVHHDKLKVGLISHVESIKNRVPVKLLITPAEAGKGGSKVKLERN